MCVCTHSPSSGLVGLISQPAVVHALLSESVHGVLVFGVHLPVVESHTPLHSSAAGHVLVMWFWSHTPCPLQPAVVHKLPSLSGQGVLFVANRLFLSHTPCPLQPVFVHALSSVSYHLSLHDALPIFCTHTPSSGLVGLSSQPAVVHVLPSESVHGVLVFGVHFPVVVSQTPLHSSAAGHVLARCF